MQINSNKKFPDIFKSNITEKTHGSRIIYNADPDALKARFLNSFTDEIDSFYCYRECTETRSYSLKVTREYIEYKETQTDLYNRCYEYFFDSAELYINDKEYTGSFMQSFLSKLEKISIDLQKGRTLLYQKDI